MTATMHQATDLIAGMAKIAAQALGQSAGIEVAATVPTQVADVATADSILARSVFTKATGTGGLVTIVPFLGHGLLNDILHAGG